MSCYTTELLEERCVFGVVKIITLVPTFRTTIADYYQGTSQPVTSQTASELSTISTAHALTL